MPIAFRPRVAPEKSGPPPPKEAIEKFQEFYEAENFPLAHQSFKELLEILEIQTDQFQNFFPKLKYKLKEHLPFKYKEIWKILETKSKQKVYGAVAEHQNVLVVGAGPCGLRTAIETQLLGAKTIVIEKRDDFSRNNVLKLWKYLIDDLKLLGAKKFFGKFATGAINHINIWKLQLLLSKVCLMLGVEIYTKVVLADLCEPDDTGKKWTANYKPNDHPVSNFEFNMIIIASGSRVAIEGFDRRSLNAKLSVAITANFVNNWTPEEAAVRQISGISKQYDQDFFNSMEKETGVALENLVYYRGDTHYFVMTTLKRSLIERGVILEDKEDRKELMHPSNINKDALYRYSIDASQYATSHFSTALPSKEFALNARGIPDVAVFDFTNLYSARNASRVMVRKGHQLLMAIVGDSLLEPFWPEGTGCARGFLSCMDTAWQLRQWALAQRNPLDIICERENIYRLLSQTADGGGGNMKSTFKSYTIDPKTRYVSIPKKIEHDRIIPLYDSDAPEEKQFLEEIFVNQQYYTPEKHKTMLKRFRKGVKKTGQNTIMLPIRVVRAFKRNRSTPNGVPGNQAQTQTSSP